MQVAAALILGMTALACTDHSKIPVIPSTPATSDTPEELSDNGGGGGDAGEFVAGTRLPVFYEANPRVFAATESLLAIKDRIDEIKALGTDVLWLMPINTLGQEKAIGSPYCIKDHKGIEPAFGTLEDLQALVAAAHERDMKVIMDWVANHTAWDHVWMAEHKDWYTQENGQVISPKGMGWSDVADLNYGSPEMRAAMQDAMLYWMEEADVDGFRCDYADGVPDDFWKTAITEIRKVKEDAVMLAEVSDRRYFDLGFDWIYGWPYQSALASFFPDGNAKAFLTNVEKECADLPEGKHILRFTTNHDQASEKSPVTLYGSAAGALAAFATTAFIGESPLIYSSQETGYARKLSFFDVNVMAWDGNKDYTDAYKEIMKIYGETAGIRNGAPTLYATSVSSVLAVYYPNGEQGLLFVVNSGKGEVTAEMPSSVAGQSFKDLRSGATAALPEKMTLKGYEYRIYQR